MNFVDEVTIHVRAGKGGNGCVAFRREKYCPRGGPSGGAGGRGGDVILVADRGLSTLLDLKYQKNYKAKDGENGRGKDQNGAQGPPLTIRVPTGTLIYEDPAGDLLADLVHHEETFVAAQGGRGGRGNMHFLTSTRQAPDFAEPGQPGEQRTLRLELKLLADVGVIGFPNVGKSTLISRVSAARPRIADYPFTTLTPNLGVVAPPGRTSFVMADVPGLIPGAHKGTGLGIRFLRHVERTRVFLHLLEFAEDPERDPIQDFEVIQQEMLLYDQQQGSSLQNKTVIVALNKLEDPALLELGKEYRPYFAQREIPFLLISAQSGEGVSSLLHTLADYVDQARQEDLPDEPIPPAEEESWHPLP